MPTFSHPPPQVTELSRINPQQQLALAMQGGLVDDTSTMLAPPDFTKEISRMEQLVMDQQDEYAPENSDKIYTGKTLEFEQFCDYVYPRDHYKYVVKPDKLYRFMFYQTFREQKKKGGNSKKRKSMIRFDPSDYDLVMQTYNNYWEQRDLSLVPQPKKQLATKPFPSIAQYYEKYISARLWRVFATCRGSTYGPYGAKS